MKLAEIKKQLEQKSQKARSAWEKGVFEYAFELVESAEELFDYYNKDPETIAELKEALLNGAKDWNQYSWGGSSLIYDSDIAERLCTPSELKKTRNGERRPNSSEEWLDTQARALYQASAKIIFIAKGVM